jgi:polysaccharide export outer membrane protein
MIRTVLLFLLALCLTSCVSYKDVPYFQDLKNTDIKENIENYLPVTIQKGDILGITVTSLNTEASAQFNLSNSNSATQVNSAAIPGYLVDEKGEIQLPIIGSLKLMGLTTTEAKNLLQKKLNTYLEAPGVSLRIMNFKVSVFGAVARPGVYPVANERITLTEALSMAGDLNLTAIRNVRLVRENNGVRETVQLDLRSKAIFNSPYFYLKNNDAIYVTPGTSRETTDNLTRNVGLAISVISILVVVISRF